MFSLLLPHRSGAEPLAQALRACRVHFIWAGVFSALVNLLYLTPTLYMMQVYDRVVPTSGLLTLGLLTAVAVFALATLSALDWLRTRLLVRAGIRLDKLLAPAILARVLAADGPTRRTQTLREFDNVRNALSGQGVIALFDTPWTPLYLACCFLLHPAIGALTLVGGAMLITLALLNESDSRPRLKKAIQSGNSAYAAQDSVASEVETIRALGMSEASINRQMRQRGAATNLYADAQLAGGRYSGAIKFLRLTMQSLALGLAAYLAVKGRISPGSIIAASVLLSRAVGPVEQLVGAWPSLVQARASWTVLDALFAATAKAETARTRLPPPEGRVSVEGVSVRLTETGPPHLRQISLRLEPGQILGVVGPSGSGKTTLARVIAGALAPDVGVIRLDGAEYRARPGDQLGRHIGYLPQVPTLFAGSVRDNVSRFSSDLAETADSSRDVDRRTIQAAVSAGAHAMIQALPEGYDTVLGPGGAGISAGQAQRIALARALFDDPVVLVLDEPNSNLDQEGEQALMTAVLAAAARGATVVLVAHRAGLLARVDRLLTLRDGTVQLQGPREEVLAAIRAATPVAAGRTT